jgi:hypothetical protein
MAAKGFVTFTSVSNGRWFAILSYDPYMNICTLKILIIIQPCLPFATTASTQTPLFSLGRCSSSYD